MKITLTKEEVQGFLLDSLRAKYGEMLPAGQPVSVRINYNNEAEIEVLPKEGERDA